MMSEVDMVALFTLSLIICIALLISLDKAKPEADEPPSMEQ